MTVRMKLTLAAAGLLAASIWTAAPAAQQAPSNTEDPTAMHRQMMSAMQADDAKLDALMKDMESADGGAKVNAMAAVVTELVRQHRASHGRMCPMCQQMMEGRGTMGGRGMMDRGGMMRNP